MRHINTNLYYCYYQPFAYSNSYHFSLHSFASAYPLQGHREAEAYSSC